jgi:ATP-dependent DNA helicase RecG
MSITVQKVTADQAKLIASIEENQFYDVKAIEIEPAKLTKAISAFANSDGGDLYVGIVNEPRAWKGFANPEAANGHIQIFDKLFPLGTDFSYEFLKCDGLVGLVLHIQINKTKGIMRASNGIPYTRKGAQCLPIDTPEKLRMLEYAKGVSSFEDETVNADKEAISDSKVIKDFIRDVVPTAEPEGWLKKQVLLRNDKPVVAGVLLFSDEPQALLPKRCGIKVYHY